MLHRLAGLSFFLFLTHEPTVSVLQSRLLAAVHPTGTLAQLASYLLPGLTAIVLLSGLGWLLERLCPRAFALMTGAPLRRRQATRPPAPENAPAAIVSAAREGPTVLCPTVK